MVSCQSLFYNASIQSLLDTIAKSEYSTHFSKEISYWKKTLSKIGDVTREWIAVQEKWTDLSKAFAIKGFKDSIENGTGFEDLNKRYVSPLLVFSLSRSGEDHD